MPQAGGGSTRWCPTPEQLMILEEMYRGGLRTPNASQIQQITAHLSYYGRIEGKNVFYWFQNHKARDRQKLRRRLCMTHHLLSAAHYYTAAANHHHLLPHQYCLDQTNLVPSTTATPYYYPFCTTAQRTSSSPASSLFQYQGEGGGGVMPEAVGRPDYPLGKLDNFGVDVDTSPTSTADVVPSGYERMPGMEGMMSPPPCCRPLKTLNLFPTSSTGGQLKDEGNNNIISKSSSSPHELPSDH